jgi:hypothetical protein
MAKRGKLTPKQEMFVKEYLVDLNASAAAKRAGYSFPPSGDGYYVYFLIDPRTQAIFYVGKGTKGRISQHVHQVKANYPVANPIKTSQIEDILSSGNSVQENFFIDKLGEADAFRIEARLISEFKESGLTNIHGGTIPNEDIVQAKAHHSLSRLLPYDVWVRSLSDEKKEVIERVFGSCREVYDKFKNQLEDLADLSRNPTLKKMVQNNWWVSYGEHK